MHRGVSSSPIEIASFVCVTLNQSINQLINHSQPTVNSQSLTLTSLYFLAEARDRMRAAVKLRSIILFIECVMFVSFYCFVVCSHDV